MSDDERDHCGAEWMSRPSPWFAILVLAIVAWVLCGCGVPQADPPAATDPATTVTVHVPFPTVDLFDEPATAVVPAETVTPRTTVAPFDPVGYVNGLAYGWTDMGPAMEAFRVVALVRGWSQVAIDRWSPFVFDVIVKESGGCPNTVGGDLFVVGTCDQYTRHGHAEDSGAAQLTAAIWGQQGALCKAEGYCSQWSIISSPWASFDAAVASFEIYGEFPWCWSAWARGYHDCTTLTATERPL